jgi:hypothetical protein
VTRAFINLPLTALLKTFVFPRFTQDKDALLSIMLRLQAYMRPMQDFFRRSRTPGNSGARPRRRAAGADENVGDWPKRDLSQQAKSVIR